MSKFIKNKRENIILCSKVGNVASLPGGVLIDHSYHNIRASVKRSLRRLGTEYIDILYLHGNPYLDDTSEIDESLEALRELKEEGAIKSFGCSIGGNFKGFDNLTKNFPIIQLHYNPLFDKAKNLLDNVDPEKNTIVISSPLSRGLLASKVVRDFSGEEYSGDIRKSWMSNPVQVEEFSKKLDTLNISNDYVIADVLKFSLSHPSVGSIIPGVNHRSGKSDHIMH